MKFAIITYILHKENNERYFSYEPYIREMNIWLKSVDEIIVVAPKIMAIPSAIETSYSHSNIRFRKIPAISFVNLFGLLQSMVMLPGICLKIWQAMKEADHIHLRCPGNIGLIASVLQIFFTKKPKTVKYAGNWDPEAKQPLSYKMQKWILSNTFLTRNMRVLVYGDWPNQTGNILPFFTASFSERENEHITKTFSTPYHFLFVGNLVEGKNPLIAIKIVEQLKRKGMNVQLDLYGEGPLRPELDKFVKEQSLTDSVVLKGNRELKELKQAYEDAHFLILASKSEGWPKAVAEAMFFGGIPIATSVSCVPWMLNYGVRGILIPPLYYYRNRKGGAQKEEWLQQIAKNIEGLINDPDKMKQMSLAGQEWSQEYTLEKFEEGIKQVLLNSHKI